MISHDAWLVTIGTFVCCIVLLLLIAKHFYTRDIRVFVFCLGSVVGLFIMLVVISTVIPPQQKNTTIPECAITEPTQTNPYKTFGSTVR